MVVTSQMVQYPGSGHLSHQGRFACAVGSEYAENLALFYFQGNIINGQDIAGLINFCQMIDFVNCVRHNNNQKFLEVQEPFF